MVWRGVCNFLTTRCWTTGTFSFPMDFALFIDSPLALLLLGWLYFLYDDLKGCLGNGERGGDVVGSGADGEKGVWWVGMLVFAFFQYKGAWHLFRRIYMIFYGGLTAVIWLGYDDGTVEFCVCLTGFVESKCVADVFILGVYSVL
ncbi:hypothetical protein GQ44DRAFT_236050 [Phaeosphaeriaceae sp. PMI808]|nr:hypothetical protein GQ44DRAFT_236050 [Phaeosphaeriaceae sp. PMI808]